jgi:hypothetical protein
LAKIISEFLNLVVVRDEFGVDTIDKNLDNEEHIEENDELASSESDEKSMQPLVDTDPDAPISPCGEGNEANVPFSMVTLRDVPTSCRID